MSSIDHAIAQIRELHGLVGTAELARLSGLPYTTVHEAQKRGFVGPSVETLKSLEAAAEKRASA